MVQQYDAYDNNSVVKDYFRSGAVLLRGILHILYGGLYFAIGMLSVTMGRDIIAIVTDRASDLQLYDAVSIGAIASNAVALIPAILIAIAYILIFVKSRNDSPESRPDAGITILNVFAILELIGVILTTVCGIAGTVIMTVTELNKAKSTSSSYDIAPLILSIVSAVISCAIVLAVAIVYKMYIGSISRTAKTNELRNKGAKAYGVFSVLKAIGAGFSIMTCIGLLIVHSHLPEWIAGSSSTDAVTLNISIYIAGKGTVFLVLLLLTVIVTFVMYIVDAKIALGYNAHIKDENANPGRYYGRASRGGSRQPAFNGYDANAYGGNQQQGGYSEYNPNAQNYAAPKTDGYGDDFYSSDDR